MGKGGVMTGRAENKRGKGKRGELLGKMKSHGDGNKIGDKNNQERLFEKQSGDRFFGQEILT